VSRVVVVGSGVSGSHAALTLLERGHDVELWDVGRSEPAFPLHGATFHELKDRLADPIAYFLGSGLDALVPPASPELLRYPPSRAFLTSADDDLWNFTSDGFSAYGSFAKGGLANGWGANALAFDDNDLAEWPVSFADMDAAYKTVYDRIPVAGPIDDELTPHLRGVHTSQPAVRLTGSDRRLLDTYQRRKSKLNKLGVTVGCARLAVVTDPSRADACDYSERCLWGCAKGSIYNPRQSTLKDCETHRGFRYVAGRLVLTLRSKGNSIDGIRYLDVATRQIREEACEAVFLAAGALQTGAIFLRTLKAAHAEAAPRSEGLLDTTVVKIPFVALRSIGHPADARSFQFNRLIAGIVNDESTPWPRYLHAELLHLTSLIYHPLIERLPFDTRTSARLFFALKPALGVATLFFPDRITSGNQQRVVDHGGITERVELHYRESEDKERLIRQSVAKMRAALYRLGCLPRGIVRSPPGGGIHYAGTVPMGEGAKRCDATGRSNLFGNLYIADGAAFPSLPSKSITMSLAAHATRVARLAEL
jgi:choline dehydrogenase-like flavoprotein